MENLSEDQIKELNEIAKLPAAEQKTKLEEFLKTLSPEQVDFLRSQQMQQQCPFCLINEGKIQSKVLYQDNKIMAVLDINPANKGHVIVFPRLHFKDSFELDEHDFRDLMDLSNKIAKRLVHVVNADGVNILISNGVVAGQKVNHLIAHIIPRFKNDGLDFTWQPKQISEDESNSIIDSFGDFKVVKKEVKKVKEKKIDYDEEERIP